MEKRPFKKEKFEEDIKQKVSKYIHRDLGDKHLVFVSITKVEMNEDYSVATIYWDTFDTATRGDIKKAIEKASGKIKSFLSKALTVRQIPQIVFVYDSQYEDEKRITDLLEQERKNLPSNDDNN